MQKRFVILTLLLSALLVPAILYAQTAGKFDPKDFTGMWRREDGHRSISPKAPEMTAAGKERAKEMQPAARSNNSAVKAVDPDKSNDPALACNPLGFPRLVIDTAPNLMEFVKADGRLLQIYQWSRTLREFWMDGRPVPSGENLDNLGPAWYGHSVARWDGDTLLVTTVGLDDRAWIDTFGNPKSSEARFEERWRRTDADTLELEITMFDPKYYTTPWVSDKKVWKRAPKDQRTHFGWYGMFSGHEELICAPMNASPVNEHGG
jgi:hypothetical protein